MTLSCTYCGKLFKKPSLLTIHERTHTGEKPFQCNYENCTSSFARKENLVRHLQSHTGARNFQCQECGGTYRSRDHLRRHILTHRSNKLFLCEICHEGFPKKTSLRDHKLEVHEIAEFQCEVCQKIFPCQSKLLTHLNSHKSFPCSHCEEVSETYQQYRSHLETHTLSDPIEHSDSIDKQYPQTRGQLVQYILEQELKNNETKEFIVPTRATSTSYPCEICHVIFRKKTLLRAHKLTSHGIAEFRCDQCQKIFSRKCRLESHQQNGACSRRGHFECPKQHCHVVFPRQEFLERHLLSCHSHHSNMTHKDIRTVVEKYISNSSDIGSIPQSPAYTTESELESVNNEDSSNLDEMIRNQLICFECTPLPTVQNISDSEVESKSIDPQTEKNSHSSRRRHYTHLRYTDLQDDVPFEFIPSVSNVPKQIFTCPIEYCRKSFSYRSVRDRHVENIHGFAGSRSKRSLMDDDEIPKKYSRTTDMEIIQDFQDINQQQFIWNELLGVPV